jgi:hypothetical protein
MYKCQKACAERVKEEEDLKNREANILSSRSCVRKSIDDINQLPKAIEDFVREHFDGWIRFSKFDLKFHDKIRPYFNAPIGKRKARWDELGGIKYPGWKGAIEGDISFFNQPLKLKGSLKEFNSSKIRNRTINGFSCLVGSDDGFIEGVNTGTGSGGTSFQYDCTIYVDDFPKIKEKYDQYIILKEKNRLLLQESDRLRKAAKQKFIAEDEQLIRMREAEKVWATIHYRTSNLIDIRVNSIKKSKEFQSAIKPADKFLDFDTSLLYKLAREF